MDKLVLLVKFTPQILGISSSAYAKGSAKLAKGGARIPSNFKNQVKGLKLKTSPN